MSSVAQRLSGGGSAFLAAAQADARNQEEAQARSEVLDERTGRVRRASKAPVSAIVFNPFNPRKTFDEGALAEMAESLQTRGQITPITVVSRQAFLDAHPGHQSALGDAEFIALDGNRRLQAARLAGLDTVRVDLNDELATTATDMLESALIANIHREDVPAIEEAQAIKQLLDKVYDGNQAAVARALGKNPQWVGQRLSLLHLTPDLQDQVDRKELGLEDARKIGAAARSGKITGEEQRERAEAAKKAAQDAKTAREAKKAGRGSQKPPIPGGSQASDVNGVYPPSGSQRSPGSMDTGTDTDVNGVYPPGRGQGSEGTPGGRPDVNGVYTGTVPEPRDSQPSLVTVNLDPGDITASAVAIREALSVRQAVFLARALINSLKGEPEYADTD